MTNSTIIHNARVLSLYKANKSPEINSYTVLVSDSWEYIEMFLKRKKKNKAVFFWNQARTFYEAYLSLPKGAKALLGYYCMLNATKAFLEAKNIKYQDMHGVGGEKINQKASLSNEHVIYYTNGILGSLCNYLGETNQRNRYTLKDILYNLPFCHRAYTLTYRSQAELFIPIDNPRFILNSSNNEAWFAFDLQKKNQDKKTIKDLGPGWERDPTLLETYTIRRKKRFVYDTKLSKFVKYHESIRNRVYYIYSPNQLWYVKKSLKIKSIIDRSTMTLIFGGIHRLSELERYAPNILDRHFNSDHNWLISEFLSIAVSQFIDEISCEITGQNFFLPGKRIL